MEYEAVIGLEVHVQIKTRSKMFASVGYSFGEPPNTLTDPVVWALPGVLPVINRDAVKKTIMVGLMLGCKIPEITKWDRKNYFYPDSPKNYQLSQYDEPLCLGTSSAPFPYRSRRFRQTILCFSGNLSRQKLRLLNANQARRQFP